MERFTKAELAEWGRRKAFAVAVLAEVWAGAKLPPQLIEHAKAIEDEMRANGTWLPA